VSVIKYTTEELEEMYSKAMTLLDMKEQEAMGEAIQLLNEASLNKYPPAQYMIYRLLCMGYIKLEKEEIDAEEHMTALLWESAKSGYFFSRMALAKLCEDRSEEYQSKIPEKEGELTDFDGKKIVINRQGLLTPVDAVLTYENGRNILTFTLDLCLIKEKGEEYKKIYNAVCKGIKEWEGEYRVFGGQQLDVRINIEDEDNVFDTVYILPLDATSSNYLAENIKMLKVNDELKQRAIKQYETHRSFANLGLKWTVTSRKLIVIQTGEDGFNDVQKIQRIARHEFGHILGLGDIYEDKAYGLEGIPKGTYRELDGYYVTQKIYHLVMSDSYGPITNNDIEMIVLAFSENAMQRYQKEKLKGKISKALGRGN